MSIAVAACIITYRRPQGLEKLLAHVSRQEGVDVSELLVVVVDNDPDLSARPVVEAARASGLAIADAHEPVPGISRARNRSVALALDSGASHLCFIDDDEFPAPTWLARLLDRAGAAEAPVVTGPVLAILPEGVPAWLGRSRLFSRRRYPTGEELDIAATGSALVHRRVFEGMDRWFDESLALSGGEDTDFFKRAYRAGFRIVWCDEAVAYEDIPPERCSLSWIARRNLREGLGSSRTAFSDGGVRRVARDAARGLLRMARGLLRGVFTLGLVPAQRLRSIEELSSGVGLVLGIFGVTIDEYRRPTGGRRFPNRSPEGRAAP